MPQIVSWMRIVSSMLIQKRNRYLFIKLIMIGYIFDIPLIFLQILQGNEYFKQKKFNEAIDCYSRSIALSPNAVAFANRAMAYLKLKRLVHFLLT